MLNKKDKICNDQQIYIIKIINISTFKFYLYRHLLSIMVLQLVGKKTFLTPIIHQNNIKPCMGN